MSVRVEAIVIRLTLLVILQLFIPPLFAEAEKPAGAKESIDKERVVNLVPLNPKKTVLLDKKNKKLILKATTCLERGVLEMFLCYPEGSFKISYC